MEVEVDNHFESMRPNDLSNIVKQLQMTNAVQPINESQIPQMEKLEPITTEKTKRRSRRNKRTIIDDIILIKPLHYLDGSYEQRCVKLECLMRKEEIKKKEQFNKTKLETTAGLFKQRNRHMVTRKVDDIFLIDDLIFNKPSKENVTNNIIYTNKTVTEPKHPEEMVIQTLPEVVVQVKNESIHQEPKNIQPDPIVQPTYIQPQEEQVVIHPIVEEMVLSKIEITSIEASQPNRGVEIDTAILLEKLNMPMDSTSTYVQLLF